jgi:hypothetical protein
MATVDKKDALERCFNCDAVAHAFWEGRNSRLAVCLPCAVEILPALAADAVVGAVGQSCGPDPLKRWLQAMQTSYWKAAASAIVRIRQVKDPECRSPPTVNGRRSA